MDEPLTKRDRAILRFVNAGELVAMRHLTACFFGQRKTARVRALALSERGFLARYRARPMSETLYTLGPLGAAHLGVTPPERMPARTLETHLDVLDVCVSFARESIEASLLRHAAGTPDIVVTLGGQLIHVVVDPVDRPTDELTAKLAALAIRSPSERDAPALIVLASKRYARLLAVARGAWPDSTPIACMCLPASESVLGPCYARIETLARAQTSPEVRAAFSTRLVPKTPAPLTRTGSDESYVASPRS